MEERESGLISLGWAVDRFVAFCGEVELEGDLRRVKAIFSNMQGQGIYWQGWAAALRQLVADEGVVLLGLGCRGDSGGGGGGGWSAAGTGGPGGS